MPGYVKTEHDLPTLLYLISGFLHFHLCSNQQCSQQHQCAGQHQRRSQTNIIQRITADCRATGISKQNKYANLLNIPCFFCLDRPNSQRVIHVDQPTGTNAKVSPQIIATPVATILSLPHNVSTNALTASINGAPAKASFTERLRMNDESDVPIKLAMPKLNSTSVKPSTLNPARFIYTGRIYVKKANCPAKDMKHGDHPCHHTRNVVISGKYFVSDARVRLAVKAMI